MKANEKVPEKIYFDGVSLACRLPIFASRNIEYVNKEVFIKKAKKWFEKQNEWHDINGIKHCDIEDFEDFIKFLESELG